MPRPPARRTRTVRQIPTVEVPSIQTKKAKRDIQLDPGANESDRVTTPRRADHESNDGQHGNNKPNLTPTGNSNDNAIASSPAENTTTTSIRPPTRARGYSSTLSLVGRKGDFNSRIGSTPKFESSILSNFKRRARQPSLLQMMQADDDSSDLDDDDFLGGLSSPQDESTPLNVARAPVVDNQLAASPSRPPVVSSPSSSESRKRKRQSQNDHTGQDLVPPGSRGSSSSTITPTPATPSMRQSVDSLNLTMATPLSSDTASPSRLVLGGHDNAADLLPRVTTVSIQAKFLPQRRIRHRQQADDSDDAGSAHEDSDEDELSREIMRRPQRSRKKGLSDATSHNANAKTGNAKKNKGKTKGSSRSQKEAPRTYSRQKPQTSDKENYLSDNSSTLSSPPPSEDIESEPEVNSRYSRKRITSRELQQQALKFAEVDKWEMDFEEVSFSESSPSR